MSELAELAPPAKLPRFHHYKLALLQRALLAAAFAATVYIWIYGIGFLWFLALWFAIGVTMMFLAPAVAEEKERLLFAVQQDRDLHAEELLASSGPARPARLSLYICVPFSRTTRLPSLIEAFCCACWGR